MKDNTVKHLEMIENVISRMAQNSFLIKGWTITIITALFIFIQQFSNVIYMVISIIPIAMFWALDGFFLFQERLYRSLYDAVRTDDGKTINFSMAAQKFAGKDNTWKNSIFSKTLKLFYIPLILLIIVISAGLSFFSLKKPDVVNSRIQGTTTNYIEMINNSNN